MDKSYSHSGFIQYDLNACLQDKMLELALSITQDKRVKIYKDFLIDDSLPIEIQKELKTVENLFHVLEEKNNFMLDPVKGQIIVLLEKVEMNKVEIKLNLVGNE